MPGPADLAGLVADTAASTLELRRLLHRHPEPAHQEHRTTDLLRRFLDHAGVEFRDRAQRTGGWVDIGEHPTIGFRADIDALPIREPDGNKPRSEVEGWMHACGHDAHAAIAAGIAVTLHEMAPDVGVRILFQPAEEVFPGGAIDMVREGLVDGFEALLAFHVDPALEVGKIGARVGPITAGADAVTITVTGPGGHTSRPHKTVDLIGAAARVASEVPAAIRNSIDARRAVVTAFGSIHGGDAANVIPSEVTLRGTVRTLDSELWDVLPSLFDKTVDAILAPTGAGYTMEYQQGIAPVVNDAEIVHRTTRAIEQALGLGTISPTETSMGGEDFSSFLTVTPGALLRLGAESSGGDLHSSSFRFNELAIPIGIQAGVSALLALASP